MGDVTILLDEADGVLAPRRTASIALKLTFGILCIPVVVGAWHMAKAIMKRSETVGMTSEAKAAKAAQLLKQAEDLDKEIQALQVALADKRREADSKWISRTRDKEEIAALSKQIYDRIEEQNAMLAQVYELEPETAPVGS